MESLTKIREIPPKRPCVRCSCNEGIAYETLYELISHLSEEKNHIITTLIEFQGNYILHFYLSNGRIVKILSKINEQSTISDLKIELGTILNLSKLSQVFYYDGIQLDNFRTVFSYGIVPDSQILVILRFSPTNHNSNFNLAKIFEKNFLILNSLEFREKIGEMEDLNLLLASPIISFIQIGGDLRIINSIALIGRVKSCYYIEKSIKSNQILFQNLISISPIVIQSHLPITDTLTIYLIFETESLEELLRQIDINNHLVFLSASSRSSNRFVVFHRVSLFGNFLVKFSNHIEIFLETDHLRNEICRINSINSIVGQIDEYTALKNDIILNANLSTDEDIIKYLDQKICNSADLLHELYLSSENYPSLNEFLILIKIALSKYILENISSLLNDDSNFSVRYKNEIALFCESKCIEYCLLKIYHTFRLSNMSISLTYHFFRYSSNYLYITLSLGYSSIVKISETTKEKLIISFENILQNIETLKRIIHLDDPELYQELGEIQIPEQKLEELKRFELDSLISLIPQEVIALPASIPLAGKNLLGGEISISGLILQLQNVPGTGSSKLIHTLRHEIFHKKWIIKAAKNYTKESPTFIIDGLEFHEAGLYIEQSIYGKFDPNFNANFSSIDPYIEKIIIEGGPLSLEQRKSLYKPDSIERSGKNMNQNTRKSKTIIICEGRSRIYNFL